ncbi:hypothetical protein ACIREO_07525 [Streptomyces sp. NPDC102441]|uniref:hypothetical protein n=1 Tax=Streptomyces sp. NPDC102441 TaxID=3366176 RepID=UPI0037FAE903
MRTELMNVAAEPQWNLMPPRAFTNGHMTSGAALEPAHQVGGGAFDYAVADDVVRLGLFDAMGHDVAAGMTATLPVAACRNAPQQNAPSSRPASSSSRPSSNTCGPSTVGLREERAHARTA